MAIGSQPRHVLARVIAEGTLMAVGGIVAGIVCGFALQQLAGTYFGNVVKPGGWVLAGAAAVLLASAVVASVVPAARAARVDVMNALRAE